MKKLFKIAFNLVSLYLLGMFILWVIAVVCGAPLNINEWSDGSRVFAGLLGAPFVTFTIVAVADHNS